MRYAKVKSKSGLIHKEFNRLKKGDTFYLFESDGTQVDGGLFLAESDPYPSRHGIDNLEIMVRLFRPVGVASDI